MFNGVVGVRFRVRPDCNLRVTHLGVYDRNGDGLQLDHRVGIFKVGGGSKSGVLVAEATVPYGRQAPLEGMFRWVALPTPVLLTSDTTYVVAAETIDDLERDGGQVFAIDPWPSQFDSEAMRAAGFDRAWNPLVVGAESTDGQSLLTTHKLWPVCPDGEEDIGGAAYGPANMIATVSK